ncbi:MAG: hypothetical protein EOP84_31480 [Verrucomicrobiaceae bacterium]|nr:MAG: hypothetical protein EOP84_31480 [Verrucomicrobiaceae bacterium]
MNRASNITWSGWWQTRDQWGQPTGFEAYRRNDDADWFDLYPALTWWGALLNALNLAATIPGCRFEHGPCTFTDHLDRRVSI